MKRSVKRTLRKSIQSLLEVREYANKKDKIEISRAISHLLGV